MIEVSFLTGLEARFTGEYYIRNGWKKPEKNEKIIHSGQKYEIAGFFRWK